MKGPDKQRATAARDALRALVEGKEITVRTHKDVKEKFGRWLAEVYVKQEDSSELYVNEYMVRQGYAVPFMAD